MQTSSPTRCSSYLLVVQMRRDQAIALDADAQEIIRRRAGHAVGTNRGGFLPFQQNPHGQMLAGVKPGHARSVGRLQIERANVVALIRSEEHTYELQSLMRISYAVFCLKNNT